MTMLPQPQPEWSCDVAYYDLIYWIIHAQHLSMTSIEWCIHFYCGCGEVFYYSINEHQSFFVDSAICHKVTQTSISVDDVIFSYNGANGPKSNKRRHRFGEVHRWRHQGQNLMVPWRSERRIVLQDDETMNFAHRQTYTAPFYWASGHTPERILFLSSSALSALLLWTALSRVFSQWLVRISVHLCYVSYTTMHKPSPHKIHTQYDNFLCVEMAVLPPWFLSSDVSDIMSCLCNDLWLCAFIVCYCLWTCGTIYIIYKIIIIIIIIIIITIIIYALLSHHMFG